MRTIPVSVVIATKDRPVYLKATLDSFAGQSVIPLEVVIIDGSESDDSRRVCGETQWPFVIAYELAVVNGAAAQRLQGVEKTKGDFIWFADDDIVLEPFCAERLWNAFLLFPETGAVNAMITNQRYTPPGTLTRFMYRMIDGSSRSSYAGRLIGPAWNLLPEDDDSLPEYVPCEWLNTTCTIYRRSALPTPIFDDFFKGYSLMEDVAVSATMARHHLLLNARTARIFHDSQPGSHKDNVRLVAEMSLVNRYYVMVRILQRSGVRYVLKLMALEAFGLITSLRTARAWTFLPQVLLGKFDGWLKIIRMR